MWNHVSSLAGECRHTYISLSRRAQNVPWSWSTSRVSYHSASLRNHVSFPILASPALLRSWRLRGITGEDEVSAFTRFRLESCPCHFLVGSHGQVRYLTFVSLVSLISKIGIMISAYTGLLESIKCAGVCKSRLCLACSGPLFSDAIYIWFSPEISEPSSECSEYPPPPLALSNRWIWLLCFRENESCLHVPLSFQPPDLQMTCVWTLLLLHLLW